ncbi:MAG: hypothetical protein ACRD36_11070, partial [Candidatus Acidiferrum sp.]
MNEAGGEHAPILAMDDIFGRNSTTGVQNLSNEVPATSAQKGIRFAYLPSHKEPEQEHGAIGCQQAAADERTTITTQRVVNS